ncbi:unnamed protein product [Cladocopium goreaui]|uniref:Uncharacterized protein n=1 Tax=Cladocopium goreaui TaxID=2562237 RepID=A0A9P1GHK6_9DINO|nr:unnamed protein product [Cladocopium goreaui]
MRWTREEFRQHAWQLADGDRVYGEQRSSLNHTMEQVSALEGWVSGLEGQIAMVSDYSESVHHGLVELGGFTRITDLTAEERRGLYATERANLVARNAMGSNYYLRGIRQQFHGSATGDNTDNPEDDESMHGESAEEEAPENDPYVSGGSASSTSRPIGVSVIMNDLTTQLNNALAREHWRDASVLQHLMMDLLDLTYQNGYDNAERRNRYMEHLIQRFEEMTADARRNGHVDVVAVYESLLQQWRRVRNDWVEMLEMVTVLHRLSADVLRFLKVMGFIKGVKVPTASLARFSHQHFQNRCNTIARHGSRPRSVRLLDQPEDAGVCRSCLHQKRWVFLLVLLVIIDLIAAATLFGHGRHQALIMGILRALLLSFSFALAVKMGLGMWSCGAEGPEETHHATGEVSELDRQRAAVANREAHSWKRNLVLGICFVGVTVESTYTGIQVLSTEEETALEALCFTLVVACMNAEFLVMKYLVERLTEEEGVLLPGVHEHRLYYQKVAQIAFCKICRERIGTRTGGPEGFMCKECDGGGRGSGFWVCLLCYRKSQNSNTQEGILRGDKGPKYVQELTSWQYFWRAIELCRPFRRVLQCAVLCTCITQLGRILLPNYQGSIINDLIAGNKQAGSDAGETTNT